MYYFNIYSSSLKSLDKNIARKSSKKINLSKRELPFQNTNSARPLPPLPLRPPIGKLPPINTSMLTNNRFFEIKNEEILEQSKYTKSFMNEPAITIIPNYNNNTIMPVLPSAIQY